MIGRNGTSTGRKSSYTTATTVQVSVQRNNAAWMEDAVGIQSLDFNCVNITGNSSSESRQNQMVRKCQISRLFAISKLSTNGLTR